MKEKIKAALRLSKQENLRANHSAWRLFIVGFLREVTGKTLRDFRWVLYWPNKPE